MTRTECYMVLNSVRRIGPARVRRLLERFGSVEDVLSASTSQLASVDGIGREISNAIVNWEQNWDLEKELKDIERLGITVIDCEDAEYPPRLAEIHDPPLVLYYQGNLESAKRKGIGIVGSRHTTSYGFESARKLGYQCAYAGLTVNSGLARGIDTAAHQGALAAKGKTAAVFGCSLEKIFPEENRVLAEKILATDGVLISEYPLNTAPDKYTFPMRNRIISGLSEGVLVVEAGKQSGAMITARMASEQGRQVFAVPGRIDNPHARGTHKLLKEGAKLVEDVQDILEEFEYLFPKTELPQERAIPSELSDEEKVVLESMGSEEVHIDQLVQKSELPSAVVSSNLLRLELKKLIHRLPGKFYVKTF